MATATLTQDYKSKVERKDREMKILKSRSVFYQKMVKDTSLTGLGALSEAWKTFKKGGWYLPPRTAVMYGDTPHHYSTYTPPTMEASKISPNRAYLHLTKMRGSIIDICDPSVEYTSNFEVASQLVHRLSGGKPTSLDTIVFLVSNGYENEKVMDKLVSMYGVGVTLKDPDPASVAIKELLLEALYPTTGEYIFPMSGLPNSFLTRDSEWDAYKRYEHIASMESLALLNGVADETKYAEISASLPAFASGADQILKDFRGVRVISRRDHSAKEPDYRPPAEADKSIDYYRLMIHGFAAAAKLPYTDYAEQEDSRPTFDVDDYEEIEGDYDLGIFGD
jgi:hypothetical protein